MVPQSQRNHLLVIEDSQGRREFKLSSPVYSLGRDPKCDLRLFSQYVSRRHATLVQLTDDYGTYYRLVDGNLKGKVSANGVRVNGRKVQAHDLTDGDAIVFGPEASATYYVLNQVETSPLYQDFETTLINLDMLEADESDTV
jgi:pSer/pThr/pTyr-binding forkhead associated (FHA) protein